ncbi:MAG: hypothetical protein M0Q90_11850 [Bacteroidales bacterium]|nr:hypothetical protein [Bacteroidales bacterium]
MKTSVSILLILISVTIFGQQTESWKENLENPKFSSNELIKGNLKSEYLKYDFSTLLTPKHDFLGFIGQDFRRIKIYFTSLTKDINNQDVYFVTGLSVVGDNVCDFEGEIKIDQVREYKSMHFGLDNKYENAGFKSQGILIGKYKFEENSSQSHSGIFEGIVTLNWFVDKFEIIHYDDIEWFSDRYRNNQYVGTWKEYKNDKEKICNWGAYRIPFSGDLDIGAGEFHPNPKYVNQGWEDFIFE